MIPNNPSKIGQNTVVRAPLEKVWEFEAGRDIIQWIAAYGMVFFGSKDKRVCALDAASGKERWTLEMDTKIHGHEYYFSVADGTLYVMGEDKILYAIDAQTGEIRWQFSAGEGVMFTPIVADGVTYVVSKRKKEWFLCAIDAQTGMELWRHSGNNDIMFPAAGYGKVFFGCKDRCVYALDAKSGEKMWEFESEHKEFFRPTVSGGKILIQGNGDLYALDVNSGALLWKKNGACILEDFLICDAGLTVVDLASGEIKAKLAPGMGSICGVENGFVYTCGDGTLCAIDMATGELKWYAVIETRWPRYFGFTCSEDFVFATGSVTGITFAINISRFTKRWEIPERGSGCKILDGMVIKSGRWGISPKKMYGYISAKDPALQSLLEVGEDVASAPIYTGVIVPFAYIKSLFGGQGRIVWPNCCCLCCGPVEKLVNLHKSIDRVTLSTEGVPYCAACYKKISGIFKKEKPGVEITRTSPPTFAFRSEKYWALFMKANRAR